MLYRRKKLKRYLVTYLQCKYLLFFKRVCNVQLLTFNLKRCPDD